MGGFAWTEEEDHLLKKCIEQYGEGKWHRVPLLAGLNRCRKSCRLRWLNYLRPNIKRGSFTEDEVQLIIKLQNLLGNRWSLIAGRLPGRTANDVKNYWNWHLSKRLHAKEIMQDHQEEENNALIKAKTKRLLLHQQKARSPEDMEYPYPNPNSSLEQAAALTLMDESSSLSTPPFHYVELEADQQEAGQELVKVEEAQSRLGVEEDQQPGFVGTDHDDLVLDIGQFDKSCKEGCSSSSSKWDWDDLVSEMDLWTDSL